MNDYLGYLIARSLGQADVVQPRPLSLFEPSPETGSIPLFPDPTNEEEQDPGPAEHPPPLATVQPFLRPLPPSLRQTPAPSTREIEIIARQPHGLSDTTPALSLLEPPPVEDSPRLALEPPSPPHSSARSVEDEPPPPRRSLAPAAVPEPKRPSRPVFEPVARKTMLEPSAQQIVIERIVETVRQPEEAALQDSPRFRRDELDHHARREPLLPHSEAELPRSEPLLPRSEPELPSLEPVALPSRLSNVWDRSAAEAPAAPEPTIHVTIGRVEVRATAAAAPEKKRPRPQAPVMSLDDYLKQRAQGGSR